MNRVLRGFARGMDVADRRQRLERGKNLTRAFQRRRGMQIRVMLQRDESGQPFDRSTLISHMKDYLLVEEELEDRGEEGPIEQSARARD